MPLSFISSVALLEVELARRGAIHKHGPLKPGADRWMRLLGEEYREVNDELVVLRLEDQTDRVETRTRAIAELAQLAQLAIGVIELLQAEEATHGR